MSLLAVDMTDVAFVCATYCMRRIGYMGTIHEFLLIEPEKYTTTTDVLIGDILVWNTNDSRGEVPALEICKGTIISSFIKFDRHYGIFEGNGLVSDVRLMGDMMIPNIRFRRLSDLLREPDGVIRFKNLINLEALHND